MVMLFLNVRNLKPVSELSLIPVDSVRVDSVRVRTLYPNLVSIKKK